MAFDSFSGCSHSWKNEKIQRRKKEGTIFYILRPLNQDGYMKAKELITDQRHFFQVQFQRSL